MKSKQDKIANLERNNSLIQQMLLDNKDKIIGYIRVSQYQDNEKIIDFGKYKGKKFGDIKDDTAYLEWFVSIGKISIEEFKLLTTKLLNIK